MTEAIRGIIVLVGSGLRITLYEESREERDIFKAAMWYRAAITGGGSTSRDLRHNILDWRDGVYLPMNGTTSKSPGLLHYLWGEGKDGDHIRKGHQGEGKIH